MHLENEVRKARLDERIKSVLIPAEDVIEMKNGKKKVKNRVFFPGYMLVEMVLDKETTHLVLSVPGVINFVGPKNKPQRVPQYEIDRILRRVAEKEEPDIVSVPFSMGDAVKVVDGPFNDFAGYVEEVNMEKNKVKVMVSIFGRPTPVELDFLQVELDTK
jgi:transcriptional antiterminator NusG